MANSARSGKKTAAELNYLALAELARHIAALVDRNETQEFSALFAAVERLLLQGEPCVSEAVTVGQLEDLQNAPLYTTENLDFLTIYFGPETKYWWDKVYAFWREDAPMTDDRKPQNNWKKN